jgi:hypothetical protein
MKDLVKSLESVKRKLAKEEMPEPWSQEGFIYAQSLAGILIKRLEILVGSRIEVKPIEPKISKFAPKLTETIYIMALQHGAYSIPNADRQREKPQEWDEETTKKIKSLSKSIVRRLQCLTVERSVNHADHAAPFNRLSGCVVRHRPITDAGGQD